MGRLYDLTADYAALQDMMEDVTEDNEQVIKDTFEAVSGEYNIKIENCCKVIKNLEGEKLAIKNERKRLELKERTVDNRIEQLKGMIEESLRSLDLKTAGGRYPKGTHPKEWRQVAAYHGCGCIRTTG